MIMRFHKWLKPALAVALLVAAAPSTALAQRTGYTKEEFVRRRAALTERTREGMIVLFADSMPQPGSHFRQDNDFFYLSGIEDLNAILVLNARTKETHVFLPRQLTREESQDGPSVVRDPRARENLGLTNVYDQAYFDEFIVRNAASFAVTWIRLGPADSAEYDRNEMASLAGRKDRLHYNSAPVLNDYRALRFRERHPAIAIRDVTPHLDALRQIKSAEEIAILRRGGWLSAEAVKLAMAASRPGVFEYELEAVVLQSVLTGGARGPIAAPIVGSGPNTCLPRYDKNMRRTADGDLVLMDFGADLDHLGMAVTRTWPVNGKFTKDQREIYEIVLAVEKACLEAYRPGATQEDVTKAVDRAMKKKGLNSRGLVGDMGHFVGLSAHDVGLKGQPFREGMVFAVEPALYIAEKNLGIRIEDTVLITRNGCEVLTKSVPKEIDEIEKLMAAAFLRKAATESNLSKTRGIL
jgi:Xaa-Pro aminopeptidase